MATTTPNNGWAVPTSTDYVKDGATAIETLGDAIDTSVGSGLLAWTSYTPTIGGAGWALGNATVTGLYCQLGKTVQFAIRVVFGSTSTFGAGRPTLSLPVTATSAAGNFDFLTDVAYFDNSATLRYLGAADFSTTSVDLFVWGSAGTYVSSLGVTSAVPFTWASTDVIYVSGTYEAA
jgi:hypothetical protein